MNICQPFGRWYFRGGSRMDPENPCFLAMTHVEVLLRFPCSSADHHIAHMPVGGRENRNILIRVCIRLSGMNISESSWTAEAPRAAG